jgi:hypothetical protein
MLKSELVYLFHLMSELYRSPRMPLPELEKVNYPSLFSLAKKNSMGYFIAEKLADANTDTIDRNTLLLTRKVVGLYDRKFQDMQCALRKLNSILSDYLLIKTYYGYPRVGADLDILVHDFDKTFKLFSRAKIDFIKFSDREKALFSFRNTKIHLHGKLTWAKAGSTFFDGELIWTKPQSVAMGDVQVEIPNADADFLIHLAHINYECLYIPLSTLIYVFKITPRINWNTVLDQAYEHGWIRTLISSVNLLDVIYHTFYSEPCPFSENDTCHFKHEGISDKKPISFPLYLPRRNVVWAFFEKRLLVWAAVNRVSRSMRLLMFEN